MITSSDLPDARELALMLQRLPLAARTPLVAHAVRALQTPETATDSLCDELREFGVAYARRTGDYRTAAVLIDAGTVLAIALYAFDAATIVRAFARRRGSTDSPRPVVDGTPNLH
jgi:hypothetical protein